MLTFFATQDHLYTFGGLWQFVGKSPAIKVRSYEWLFVQQALSGGTYVFTDIERLSSHELVLAAAAASTLRGRGNRVLNDPARALCRPDLLQRLHTRGINRFRAYPASQEPRPARFPVFLKGAAEHVQRYTDLIADQTALDARLAELMGDGIALRDLLVIEFAAKPIRDGAYRKHSVFRVGEHFLPHTPVIEDRWYVKYGKAGFSTPEELEAAVREMNENSFADVMEPVFKLASIDYGRVDFGFDEQGLAVYEINTNPALGRRIEHQNADYQDTCNRSSQAICEVIASLSSSGNQTNLPWLSKQRWWQRRQRPKRP
jgi:hypothetical protein